MAQRLWVITLLSAIGGSYFAFEAGFIKYLWEADLSKLSFLIIALFLNSMLRLGKLLFLSDEISEEDLDPGYETSNLSMALGMLGTVIGFIAMTMAFNEVDVNDIQNIKELFAIATGGMSTALLTTATGLVSSIILRVLYYITHREML